MIREASMGLLPELNGLIGEQGGIFIQGVVFTQFLEFYTM